MDRGIPTEGVAEMRQSPTPIHYLVGTPKAAWSSMSRLCWGLPWEVVRQGDAGATAAQEGGVVGAGPDASTG